MASAELTTWLDRRGFHCLSDHPLTGDVSPRRYSRLVLRSTSGNERSAILATYPPEMAGTYGRFLRSSALLAQAGVRVPEIYASDEEHRFMLLEDLGEVLYQGPARTAAEWHDLYREADSIRQQIAALPLAPVEELNPPLDLALFQRELKQTWTEFLDPRQLVPDPGLEAALTAALDRICRALAEEPRVPCHRDYMIRNLIATRPEGRLAVIDHQDLRPGPASYDLASLLNDSRFPEEAQERRILDDAQLSMEQELAYRRAAVQRTLKAVGTFAAFARRGSDRHLALIPGTLRRALYQLRRLPGEQDLARHLETAWQPAL